MLSGSIERPDCIDTSTAFNKQQRLTFVSVVVIAIKIKPKVAPISHLCEVPLVTLLWLQ